MQAKTGFDRSIWFFLLGSTVHGLGQAFMYLFLNFYLKALGLDDAYTGLVNALPALTTALLGLPAIYFTRRLGEVRMLQVGGLLGLSGVSLIALASGAAMAMVGAVFQGVGSALVMVATSPFMAKATTPANRVTLFSLQTALMTGAGFIGNFLGGRVPGLYASLVGGSAQSLPALRAALVAAAAFSLLGLISMLLIPQPKPVSNPGEVSGIHLQVQDKRLMFRLVFPNVLVGLGAGLTIPYLNLFIEAKFGVAFETLGNLFGWTSLATAAMVLVQPWLVRRLGHLKTGLLVEATSLPFLALLGYSNQFGLVILALFTRGALMNATGPAWGSYAMERLSEADRPVYSGLNHIGWQSAWAVAASLSGLYRKYMGTAQVVSAFNYLFLGTLIAYALSMLLKYLWLYLPDKAGIYH